MDSTLIPACVGILAVLLLSPLLVLVIVLTRRRAPAPAVDYELLPPLTWRDEA